MAEKKVEKQEVKKEFLKIMNKLEKAGEVEKMIKNNRIAFRVGDIDYRVRKPNHAEQMDIEKFRRKKYLELMDDDSMMFRKQWIEKYKAKGIDIDGMEKEIVQLQKEAEQMSDYIITALKDNDIEAAKSALVNEDNLNKMQIEFRRSHVQRMSEGICAAEAGLIFIDMVDNIEKIGDHLTNIAQAIIGGLQWEGIKPKVVDVS